MRNRSRTILFIAVLVMLFTAFPTLAQEESASPLDALGINLGFLIAQFINFGLIFAALYFGLWGRMTNMLDARAAKIEKGLEDAAAAASARQNAEAEVEKILADARVQAAQVVEEARSRGDEVARSIENEARVEADRIRQEARVAAQGERNAQLAGLRGQVAAISSAVAQRLIGETLDENRQRQLIDNFFATVPADARQLAGELEVVSAMPLSDEEQSRVRNELNGQSVIFSVDPSILGGLIVRSEERVIDGSVRKGLTEISERMR